MCIEKNKTSYKENWFDTHYILICFVKKMAIPFNQQLLKQKRQIQENDSHKAQDKATFESFKFQTIQFVFDDEQTDANLKAPVD